MLDQQMRDMEFRSWCPRIVSECPRTIHRFPAAVLAHRAYSPPRHRARSRSRLSRRQNIPTPVVDAGGGQFVPAAGRQLSLEFDSAVLNQILVPAPSSARPDARSARQGSRSPQVGRAAIIPLTKRLPFTSAPLSMRNCTTDADLAQCNAVPPLLSLAFTSAPLATSFPATNVTPLNAAACKAVRPAGIRAFTCAWCASSSSTTPALPANAATINGVSPDCSGERCSREQHHGGDRQHPDQNVSMHTRSTLH
jgi:hypothetical protein